MTGLLSNAAYNPWLNGNIALQSRSRSPLDFYLFTWPAHPLVAVRTEPGHPRLARAGADPGDHRQTVVGDAALLHAGRKAPESSGRDRADSRLVFLVAGIFFELVTGLLFEEYWVPYHFDFTAAHLLRRLGVLRRVAAAHGAEAAEDALGAAPRAARWRGCWRTDPRAHRAEPPEDPARGPPLARAGGAVGADDVPPRAAGRGRPPARWCSACRGSAQAVGGPLRAAGVHAAARLGGRRRPKRLPVNGTFSVARACPSTRWTRLAAAGVPR